MTPKEKAIELWGKYYNLNLEWDGVLNEKWAKEGALITVDEIIKSREEDRHFDDTLSSIGSEYYTPHPMYLTYWLQVKQEIEQL
jgi:hypothetical protein